MKGAGGRVRPDPLITIRPITKWFSVAIYIIYNCYIASFWIVIDSVPVDVTRKPTWLDLKTHDLITCKSNVQLNFPKAFTTCVPWCVLVQSNTGVSFEARDLTCSCLAARQLTFLNKQLKSTWTQSPHVASNRIFSPWRSPRPRIWPTIHITAEVRQYARRLMYLWKKQKSQDGAGTELCQEGRLAADRHTDIPSYIETRRQAGRQTDRHTAQTDTLPSIEIKSIASTQENKQRLTHFFID